jgi:putative toxin-antitoxin system antitoxin component (TIGR02293 family)
MAPFEAISEVLGGSKVIGRVSSSAGLREAVRAGLPVSALTALQHALNLNSAGLSALLAVPERTLARRKKQRRLTAEESDRLVRAARILTRATSLLGSREKAGHWLRTPNRALGSATPLSLLDTGVGAEQVDELLGRIEFGIYS